MTLMYPSQTCQEYIEVTEQDVYRNKKVILPKPESYVIFVGKRANMSAAEKATKEANRKSVRRLYERGTPVEEIAEILEVPAE